MNEDLCVGGGACEYPCPVRSYRAIYVEGNPKHLIVKKPVQEKIEDMELGEEEFPF